MEGVDQMAVAIVVINLAKWVPLSWLLIDVRFECIVIFSVPNDIGRSYLITQTWQQAVRPI